MVPDHEDFPTADVHGLGASLRPARRGAQEAGAGDDPNAVGSHRGGAGELIDKITILEIKAARIEDPEKLRNVETELKALCAARDRTILATERLGHLTAELRAVNESLWDIEDAIRRCEQSGDFGPQFVELARSVYKDNDHRAELKRQINVLLGSGLIEEKSYAACS